MNASRYRGGFNRRRFLKLSGLVGGGALLAACQPAATAEPTTAATAAAPTTAPTQAPPTVARFTARLAVEQASVPDFAEIPQVWAQRSG
ncbi:MAG: twin-arginine translocation signal domain-containing protein, partial [Anaerolineales bacterium]|nr:twin-arginine translocation signal domain-containing protein [Anaerolineales bacterium]